MANLQQFGVAAALYASDNDGYLPAARRLPGLYWKDLLNPYLPNAIAISAASPMSPSKLACPTYYQAGYRSSICGTYSWNANFGFVNWAAQTESPPRKLHSVSRPSRVSLAMDGTGLKGKDINDYFMVECADPTSGNSCAALHQNAFNTLFVDGHVEKITKSWINNRSAQDVFWGNPAYGW